MSDQFPVPAIDYTTRDYRSTRDEAIARIPHYTEEWTDNTPSDPGIVLLQLFAGMHDIGHFYLDQKIKESFITDVRGRRSLISLAALIGQRPKWKAPATSLEDFTLVGGAIANAVPIPVGTLLSSVGISPTQYFETTESAVIPAGDVSVTGVQVIAGRTYSQTVGASDGTAYQEFLIPATNPALDEGIVVEVGAVAWTYIEALGQAGPEDEVWSLRRDEQGNLFVRFGNGTVAGGNGFIPASGDAVTITWREGGGRATNVGSGVIRTVVSQLYDTSSNPVSVTCNNPTSAQGGDEEELVSVARRRIPRAFRANDRGVISQDIEALAESIPGVLRASAYVSGINQWTLYIMPHPTVGVGSGVDPFGYTVLTSKEQSDAALAVYVQERLARKVMQTDHLICRVVNFKPVDIQTVITLKPGANRSEVEARFAQFVASYFDVAPPEREIGDLYRRNGDLHVSDWDAGIDNITGVDFVDTTIFQLRPQVERVQAVGDPLFANIAYTPFTSDAIWEVLFLDSTSYKVYRQEITGGPKVPQAGIGALGAGYTSTNNEVRLLIELPGGNTAPMSGDRWRFRSGPQRATARALTGEVLVQGNVNFSVLGGS